MWTALDPCTAIIFSVHHLHHLDLQCRCNFKTSCTAQCTTWSEWSFTAKDTSVVVGCTLHRVWYVTLIIVAIVARAHTLQGTSAAYILSAFHFEALPKLLWGAGLHKLRYPGIRDMSTWSKFGAHGEHGDVFLFSNLGALWFSENLIRYSLHVCLREVKNNLFSFKHSYLRHFLWRF